MSISTMTRTKSCIEGIALTKKKCTVVNPVNPQLTQALVV